MIFIKDKYIVERKLYAKIILLLILPFALSVGHAQKISAKADRTQIVLGEQINLKLQLENIDNNAMQITEWFAIPDTGNHIEVIRRAKVDTIKNGSTFSFSQDIVITSFDSGRWSVPIKAPSIEASGGLAIPVDLDSVIVNVNPADVSQLRDFHGIKEVVDVQFKNYSWLYYIAGVLLLILLILLLIKLLKKKNHKPVYTSVVKGPPLEWALKEISGLQQEDLITQNKEMEYFTRLDDICRTYYDERTFSNTHYLTTRETFERLRKYLQEEKDRISYYELSKLKDAVKFARYKPSQQQADNAAGLAKETLQTIEEQILNEQNKLKHSTGKQHV